MNPFILKNFSDFNTFYKKKQEKLQECFIILQLHEKIFSEGENKKKNYK